MALWIILLLLVATTVVAGLLAKRDSGAKASALGDFQVPTAQEARPIPVLWGTVKLTGPNVVWYGDLKTKAIKQGSLFGSTTVGYKYYLGMQLALCHGAVDKLIAVYAGTAPDDTEVPFDDSKTTDTTDYVAVYLNGPKLFGGDKKEGGIEGWLYMYKGTETQSADPYLVQKIGVSKTPPYHGLCHAALHQPYLGTSNYIKNFSLVLSRTTATGGAGGTGGSWHGIKGIASGSATKGSSSPFWANSVGVVFSGFALALGALPADAVIVGVYACARASFSRGFGGAQPFLFCNAHPGGSLGGWTGDSFSPSLPDDEGTPVNCYGRNMISTDHTVSAMWNVLLQGAIAAQVSSTLSTWHEATPPPSTISIDACGYAIYYTSATPHIDTGDGVPAPFTVAAGQGLAWALPSLASPYGLYDNPNEQIGVLDPPQGSDTANGFAGWTRTNRPGDPIAQDGEGTGDIGGDANPVNIIRECMQNKVWGCGIAPERFNQPAWDAAASTLFYESFGMSMIVDSQSSAEELIAQVCQHINGVIYTDPATGLWEIKLIRPDYDPATLLHITEDDIIEKPEFNRGSWSETLNEIKVTYVDRHDNFKEHIVQAHESANLAVTGELASQSLEFKGISNAPLANRVAMRELRAHSYPMATARIKCKRKAWALRMGAPFLYSYASDGIDSLVMRVTSIDYGTLGDGAIEVEAAEDVFGVEYSAFSDPIDSGWLPPGTGVQPPAAQLAFDAPFQMMPTTLGQFPKGVFVGAARNDVISRGFEVWEDDGDGGGYRKVGTFESFCPSGTLRAAYSRKTAALDPTGFILDNAHDLDSVQGTDAAGRVRGDCLLMFEGTQPSTLFGETLREICAFQGVTANSDGSYTFTNIVRGVYDTLPFDHAAGTRVYVLADQGTQFVDLLSASAGAGGSDGGDQFQIEGE